MALTASEAKGFCDSKAFKGWRGAKESESKVQVAIVERLNGVIRSIGSLAKIINGRR